MKRLKKALALALALTVVMAFSGLSVFAADGDLTVDPKVTVTGFESGDTVTAYQFVTWDADNNQWKVAANVGLTLEQITDGLTKEELATLASHKDKMTAVTGTTSGATWEKTCGTVATAGSYLILVTSNNVKYVYNPAVVSADFNNDNSSASLTLSNAEIKKQPITVDKKADKTPDDYDVQVGDIVPFTVTVTVPQYNANWTEPTFEVKDQLSTGLTIKTAPTIEGLTAYTDDQTPYDYKITAKGTEGSDGFTIQFSDTYLKNNASKALDIKYTALVGDAVKANAQVHEETNTVTLKFSNDPTNNQSHKEITDETHHYTFAIDANRFGTQGGKTKELIKVGVDDNGQTITSWKEEEMPETVSPLAGAEFTLTGTGPNNKGTVELKATSGSDGSIRFENLEVGTYTLKETKAPAGYVKDNREIPVVISATYGDDGVLQTYSIKVNGEDIASYTATTNATEDLVTVVKDENNMSFPIVNKKGSALPSTGGIGTTIFYIVGAILVVGAGILLISRRRMAAK